MASGIPDEFGCPADFSRVRYGTIYETRTAGRNEPSRAKDAKGSACQVLRRSPPCCRTRLYVGIVNLPGYGVVDKRGDFDPLIPDEVFYRVQAILTGRVPETRSLDDAFIYKESIDLGTYERQRDRLREELTLVEIDRHGSKVEEFDVEGILNFAERVLPRASDLWIQASLEQRQRLQRLFFPQGVAFSGKAFDRTVVTSSLFEYLRPLETSNENLVDQNSASWNRMAVWLRCVEASQCAFAKRACCRTRHLLSRRKLRRCRIRLRLEYSECSE